MSLKESLKQALYPLYEELAKVYPEQAYTTFCVQWGEKYDAGGMVFVGRATYGWAVDDRDTERLFREGCDSQIFARADQMRWVQDTNYCSRSAFWRVIHNVTDAVIGRKDDWYQYIAWDNLYKLSPDGSNPSASLCRAQESICFEIFRREMSVLRPKVAFLLTGKGWYYDFLCSLNDDTAPDPLDAICWDRYEAVAYRIGDTVYIGSEHPQGKPQKEHIAALAELAKRYVDWRCKSTF